jgi:hypothetical protein
MKETYAIGCMATAAIMFALGLFGAPDSLVIVGAILFVAGVILEYKHCAETEVAELQERLNEWNQVLYPCGEENVT